jgi:hypothetical protein
VQRYFELFRNTGNCCEIVVRSITLKEPLRVAKDEVDVCQKEMSAKGNGDES